MSSLRLALASIVLVFAIACGGYSASPPLTPSVTPTPGGPAVAIPAGAASLGNRAYSPDDLDVTVGSTVTWTNTDSTAHTSTSDLTGWSSGDIAPGKQFSVAFPTAGTFKYHCTIHPGMVGTVSVH